MKGAFYERMAVRLGLKRKNRIVLKTAMDQFSRNQAFLGLGLMYIGSILRRTGGKEKEAENRKQG